MTQVLQENPLLLLFVVAAIGYPLGRISFRGASLGVAAVLFAGLGVGAFDPNLKLPEVIYQLGLVLFVYTVGLSSGGSFLSSLKHKGVGYNLLVLGVLITAASIAAAAHFLFSVSPAHTAGIFAGSLTNTPALAAVLEYATTHASGESSKLLSEPVVGYSLTYPFGVVGMMLAIMLFEKLYGIDYAKEAERVNDPAATGQRLVSRTIQVTREEVAGKRLHDLAHGQGWDVVFSRIKRNGTMLVARGDSRVEIGDLVTAVGTRDEMDTLTSVLGETSDLRIELDRSQLDYRRIFVSNPRVAGHSLRELDLPQQFGAVVTRVRRGDVELLPSGKTVLELGDRVRVLTNRSNMEAVTSFFGDSYRALSEMDFLTFGLGLMAGLLLGLLPIPLPGGVTIKLGIAGGPLLVSLALGALKRTGPLVWALPYSVNLTLRQIGLVFFLAGVGTRSGHAFFSTLREGQGMSILLTGAVVTFASASLTLWAGYKLLKIPAGLLIGVLSGLQTQPALLGFSCDRTRSDLPNVGYAVVYPLTIVAKIVLAQVLAALLM